MKDKGVDISTDSKIEHRNDMDIAPSKNMINSVIQSFVYLKKQCKDTQ